MKKIPVTFWVGLLFGFLTVLALALAWPKMRSTGISNFDECVAAGNPVMESYPRQCRANGKTFVEVVAGFDEPRPIDPPADGGICVNRCGDGACAEIVCLGSGCPCAESAASCPTDCRK